MRLLLVSDSYPPIIGGASRAAQQLSRQLALRGDHVTVATVWQRDLPPVEQDGDVRVHRLRSLVSRIPALSADQHRYTPPPFPDPELVWRLRTLIRRFRPELVHSYGWLSYSVIPALAGTKIPLVLAAREYANVCAVRTLVRQGRQRGTLCSGPALSKCMECAGSFYGQPKGVAAVTGVLAGGRMLRRRVDALHSVSRFNEAAVVDHVLLSSASPRRVIPDFREDDIVEDPDPSVLNELPTEPYMLWVGGFRRIKGDELLIEAYGQLSNPPPLVMFGSRSPEPLPLFPPGVHPHFNVSHGTVMAAWDRALFGVFPSIFPEPLGDVVHEAMSHGRPVIGTRPGGHADIIEDGKNGLLVPVGNLDALVGAIQTLLANADLRNELGQNARQRAQLFTPEFVVPEFEEFFREVRSRR